MTDDILVLKALISASKNDKEFLHWTSLYLRKLQQLGQEAQIKISLNCHPVVISSMEPDIRKLREEALISHLVDSIRVCEWFHAFGAGVPSLLRASLICESNSSQYLPKGMAFKLCSVEEYIAAI